jgi:DTW domain-containing protein YfiP
MDLKTYLQNKKKQPLENIREYCFKCFRPKKTCFCHDIKAFDTNVHYVILMHPKEARKEKTGTGRLAHLHLNNSRIIVGTDFTHNDEVNMLISDPQNFPMVLYPGVKAKNLSNDEFETSPLQNKKPVVFLIDGTWFLAKKMMRESKNLNEIPRICFTPTKVSRFSIKTQPHKFCLSTIEAIHLLITELNKNGMEKLTNEHDSLIHILDKLVNLHIDCANDPNLKGYRRSKYKTEDEKKNVSRWEKRKLFFE